MTPSKIPENLKLDQCRQNAQDKQDRQDTTKADCQTKVPRNLADLPRAQPVFSAIEMDERIVLKLPPCGATSGKIISHVSSVVERLFDKHKPLKFVFGLTHDPMFRFYNPKYGYHHAKNKFEHMVALYAAADVIGPAFLQSTLIDKYGRSFALNVCTAL